MAVSVKCCTENTVKIAEYMYKLWDESSDKTTLKTMQIICLRVPHTSGDDPGRYYIMGPVWDGCAKPIFQSLPKTCLFWVGCSEEEVEKNRNTEDLWRLWNAALCKWRKNQVCVCMCDIYTLYSLGFYGRPWSMEQRKVLFQWWVLDQWLHTHS